MKPSQRLLTALCVGAILAGALSGCGSATTSTTLTVSAASSLTGTFTAIGRAFESAHPGVVVTFNFGGSSALAEQIIAGAPVDVFAAASVATMDTAIASGRMADPRVVATNSMAVAVPSSNPAQVTQLSDLGAPGVTVAICQESVPCGSAATSLFDKAGLAITPVTLEPDVKSVLAKVTADEVDAGIVYVTDVAAAGSAVKGIAIPNDVNVSTTYQIALARDSQNADLSREFIDFVLGSRGQEILRAAGFGAP